MNAVRFLLLNILAILMPLMAVAGPSSFVYQGQIIKPDDFPLEGASVDFTIQVLSPSPTLCVLYEETHNNVNMSDSNGIFALPVGSGTVGSGHYANIDDAFDNSRGSESPATCDGVAPYDANTGDTRVLRVSFDDGSGAVTVADSPIRSVPFAQYASKVDGLSGSDLLQVNTTAPTVLSQTNLEWVFQNTRYTELQALINGTSSQYMVSSPSSAVNFNGQVIDNIAAPSDGNDATNKNYVDSRIGGQNADALVSAPTITQDGYVLSWNNTNNEYELIDGSAAFGDNLGNHTATTNIQTGSNYISNDGTASQGLSFDGSNNANFSQNLTVSQGFSVTNGINSAGNVEIQSQSTLRLGDSDNSDHVILQAPATVTAYTMQLPDAASPAAGRVLKSDASGNLVWATDNDTGGDITGGSSVGVGGVDIYSGESAGVLQFRSINDGNGTSVSNDVVNNEVEINIDIASVADETSIQGVDTILIRDDSDSGNLKEISRTNFVLSEAEVDAFVSDNNFGDVTGAANVGAGAGQVFRNEVTGVLNLKSIAAGSSKLSVTNNANDISLDVVEANINHDNLSGFIANEHIDHSGVSIATAADSGLSGGGNITATRNLSVDIAGTTDETSIQGADTLLIRDDSAGALREMTRTNFVLSESEVDAFVSNNGYLTSFTELDPKVQTLTTAEVDQLENIDSVTVTNTQWGYLGAMSGQPLESESDPKAQTLTTAEVDQLENIDNVTVTNTQWGYLGAMGGQPLESESDPKAQTLTTAEVDQLENIDSVTLTNTQWGYLGAMGGQPLESESDPKAQTLTTAEVDQLENIDSVTVTNTQWGYLGAMSGQPLESESDPKVQTLTTAEVDQLENIGATTVSATQWGYLGAMGGQPLESESDPQVGALTSGRWCRTDGSEIICDVNAVTDTDTTYTAGDDLDLTTTTFSLEDDISVSKVRASSASGLALTDDSGTNTNGVFIEDGGEVGIGTASPGSKLDVDSGTNDNPAVFRSSGDPGVYIGLRDDTTSGNFVTGIGAIGNELLLRANDQNAVRIEAVSGEAIRVDSSGDVGIGTASPAAKLDVAGDVKMGNSSATCSGTTEGSQRYQSGLKRMEYCNGTSWSEVGSSNPTGVILPVSSAACPGGYLAANGSAVSRTTYSALFSSISTMYGSGDGSTTFNLPDYRGYFLRGWDNGAGNDPDAGSRTDRGDGTTGDNVGTIQSYANASHTHSSGTLGGTANSAGAHTHGSGSLGGSTNSAGAHSHSYSDYYRNGSDVDGGDGGTGISGLANASRSTASAGAHTHTLSITGSTASAGAHTHSLSVTGSTASSGGNETRPKNVNVLYCIKY